MSNLTSRAVAYVGSEEGLVLETYKDSKGIWTWALGVTAAAGVNVLQYKDRPSTLDAALRASVKLIRDIYLPRVERAFAGHPLTDAQLAAAISFHWNTGAIGKADWVRLYCAGDHAGARAAIMNWSSHGELTARREREQALFFDGAWPADLRAPVYAVAKPSYRPTHPVATDIAPLLRQIMGGA